jgi:hypothetical protein
MADFTWALEQMKQGKKVRRKAWFWPARIYQSGDNLVYWGGTAQGTSTIAGRDIFATDWELYEEPVNESEPEPTSNLTFSQALEYLKQGKRVARDGWNGKGMWLKLVDHKVRYFTDAYHGLPWIGIKTADNSFVPWAASQTDLLAEDWRVVE